MRFPLVSLALVVGVVAACSPPYGSRHWPRSRESRPKLIFDLSADLADTGQFWDAPFPADARVLENGAPDVRGLPNPFGVTFVARSKEAVMAGVAESGAGFSPLSVVSFRFDRAVPSLAVVPLSTTKPASGVQLVDLTPGRVGQRIAVDVHVVTDGDTVRPAGLLQLAPVTGLSMLPGTWAAIVRRDVDGDGLIDLDRSPVIDALLAGREPDAVWRATFGPLVEQLHALGVDPDDVAAATVFTVAEPERKMVDRLQAVRKGPAPTLKSLVRGRATVTASTSMVELAGVVEQPQHQAGEPPHLFEGGTFVVNPDGGLAITRTEDAPFLLSIPKGKMPAKG